MGEKQDADCCVAVKVPSSFDGTTVSDTSEYDIESGESRTKRE
jgi:hypothetical protein